MNDSKLIAGSAEPASHTNNPDHILELVNAAQAVVRRWHSTSWKDTPTADYINRLERAVMPFVTSVRIDAAQPSKAIDVSETIFNFWRAANVPEATESEARAEWENAKEAAILAATAQQEVRESAVCADVAWRTSVAQAVYNQARREISSATCPWSSFDADSCQRIVDAIKPLMPAPPSPTTGMNIAQRILHVGGRNNAAGYVEFGSIQAVEALVRQVLRDLPKAAHQQAVQCAQATCDTTNYCRSVQRCTARDAAPAQPAESAAYAGLQHTLWVLAEHNALHFGENHSTVMQALQALAALRAPQQEVQEPHGWLYEWTHSSAIGKPDTTVTGFTRDEEHARKHHNFRAVYTTPQPAPSIGAEGLSADATLLDVCTDPNNCKRCAAHPNHRNSLAHAGIPATDWAQKGGAA